MLLCLQVLPDPELGDEEVGDSVAIDPVELTQALEAVGSSSPTVSLGEGDLGSSSSSPARSDMDSPAAATNLRHRRVVIESESAKRARMDL